MAGGPIFPHCAFPSSGGFPNIHIGTGNNGAIYDEGLGVASSILVDVDWCLRFQMPPALPAGSPKLLLRALASNLLGISGNAIVESLWNNVIFGQDPTTGVLTSEGTNTIAWANVTSANRYRDTYIPLDGISVLPSSEIVMTLHFESTNWTLPVVSTWIPSIIWE
jgi:hypothetical protein